MATQNTNGSTPPIQHIYVPRDDVSVLINGVVYVQESAAAHHIYIPRADGSVLINGAIYTAQAPVVAAAPAVAFTNMTAVPQPTIFAQPTPIIQQPQFMPQAMYPMQSMVMPQAQSAPQFYTMPAAYPPYAQPAFGSIGYTGSEMQFHNMAQAKDSEIDKPQEMKPADDDPLRIYWVREKDGTYTQRNRVTIDSGDLGEIRWYCEGGRFYAVRLSDG